jgi:hypothetical protein
LQRWNGAIAAFLRPPAVAGAFVGIFEMNMNTDQDNFDSLRRILALKRHEQPPPGYFNSLSSKICARIESRERINEPSFFARFFADGIKPALAYSFVLSVCALAAYGLNSFLRMEREPALVGEAPEGSKSRAALEPEPRDYQAAAPWLTSAVQVSSNVSSVFSDHSTSLMGPVPMPMKASFSY